MNSPLASISWAEHFQLSSSEVEEIQPLLDRENHYRYVRDLFGARKDNALRLALLLPWTGSYYPTQMLRACLYPNLPIAPVVKPLPIARQCEVVLLWALYGTPDFQEAASKLAAWLVPLIEAHFLTLWSLDGEYNEKETRLAAALLLLACGRSEAADRLYSPDLPKNPFYAFLFQSDLKIDWKGPVYEVADLGYRLDGSLALTLCGEKCGAGAFQVGAVKVSAFGPQTAPLNDSKNFGIDTNFSNDGWFRSSGSKECWFRMGPKVGPKSILFEWNQVGVEAKGGLALSFYLVADTCKIDGKVFKPKSLQRFLGEASKVVLGEVVLEIDRPLKIELIPLAGEGCFWGASFLLAIWLPPFDGTLCFQFSSPN